MTLSTVGATTKSTLTLANNCEAGHRTTDDCGHIMDCTDMKNGWYTVDFSDYHHGPTEPFPNHQVVPVSVQIPKISQCLQTTDMFYLISTEGMRYEVDERVNNKSTH